jgi:hypothetical protein
MIKRYSENIAHVILDELSGAKACIKIAVAWITDIEIINQIERACKDGIDVEIIISASNINTIVYPSLMNLYNAGAQILVCGAEDYFDGGIMHHKFCIIDNKKVITGSYNWSNQAKKNYENIVLIEDTDNAKDFSSDFIKIKKDSFQLFVDVNSEQEDFRDQKSVIAWWDNLNDDWKKEFRKIVKVDEKPTISQLKALFEIDELKISKGILQENCMNLESLSPVKRLKNLKTLAIEGTDIEELGPISNLKNLESLQISGTKIRNISAIRNLLKLKVFHALSSSVQDLSPLSQLKNLEEVYFSNNKLNVDLSPIAFLENIRRLAIGSTNFPVTQKEVNYLSNFKKLEKLSLTTKGLISLFPLKNSSSLKLLRLEGDSLDREAISIIAKMRELCELSIKFHSPNINSLQPVSNLYSLETLTIHSQEINSLEPLSKLINLRWLSIESGNFSSLEPLSKLSNLEGLNIQHTNVSILKPILCLKKLKNIFCTGTPLAADHKSMTKIKRILKGPSEIEAFNKANPTTLVSFLY